MAKIVITVVCSVGVALAIAVIVFGRGRRYERSLPTGATAAGHRVVEGVRQACALLAAGFAGGVLGLGMGGRLMMRILAATSPDAAGRRTEAGEIVGEVTTGGTVFLVLFLGGLGVFGSLVYGLVRQWLPSRSLAAGAIGAGIGGGLLIRPSELLNPDNPDFAILEPRWLAVLLCVGVIVVAAMAIGVLADAWLASWPTPRASVAGVAGLAPLVLCVFPPIAGMAAIVIVARTVRLPTTATTASRRSRLVSSVLGAAGVVGGVWVLLSATAILF